MDEKQSGYLLVTHVVPQGSILGPVLFNISVSSMDEYTSEACLKYANNTSLYYHTAIKDLDTCVKWVNDDLVSIKFG